MAEPEADVRPRVVMSALLALAVAFVVVLRLGVGGVFVSRAIDDVGQSVAALIACVVTAWRARRSDGRRRLSWMLLSAALGSWAAGELVWSYYELLSKTETPFPSFADVGFLLFPVFAFPAVLVRPSTVFAGRGRFRVVLDGTMVAASLFILSWSTSLGAVYRAGGSNTLAFAVSLAYPASDVMMLTVVVLVLIQGRPRRDLLILAAGLVAMALADSGFAYLTTAGTYHTGSVVDLAWFAAFLVMGTSALFAEPDDENTELRVESPFGIALPYVIVLLSAAAEVAGVLRGSAAGISLVVTAAALAALLVRQLLVVLDNRRLALDVIAQREELSHRAFHDPLTGLANRALFYDRVAHAVDLHDRDLRPVSIMFVDLDDFKAVNDAYGHDAGDAVLCAVAERLSGVVRTGDTIARLGGDEFAVLLEDDGDATVLAIRLLDALSLPVSAAGRRIPVRASVGTTTLDPVRTGADIQELLKQADLAMYAAKRAGKGTSVSYTPALRSSTDDDLDLRVALVEDIRRGAIHTAFQPIVHADSRSVFAMEALARWTYRGAPMMPQRFLPVADRAGLLSDLDLLMVRNALALATDPSHRHHRVIVAANFGLARFRRGDVSERLARLIAEFDVPAETVIVEISEQDTLDAEHTAEALAALRDIGVSIAIDDFGVGYSNLTRLDALRPDIVKLDRAFVEPLRNPNGPRTLVRGVIDLAHDLGAVVVGEGVETERQLETLCEFGCDAVQGYLIGMPTVLPVRGTAQAAGATVADPAASAH